MLGSETLYKVQLENPEHPGDRAPGVMIKSQDFSFREGEQVLVGVEEDSLYFFDGEKNRIRSGDRPEEYRRCCRLAGREEGQG